jgi:hypothetical protein
MQSIEDVTKRRADFTWWLMLVRILLSPWSVQVSLTCNCKGSVQLHLKLTGVCRGGNVSVTLLSARN